MGEHGRHEPVAPFGEGQFDVTAASVSSGRTPPAWPHRWGSAPRATKLDHRSILVPHAGRTRRWAPLGDPRVEHAVGLTDAKAVAAGHTCDCRTLPLSAVPRALVNRDVHGLIKLVADAGHLLGVHVLADGAGDVISAAVYALTAHLTVQQLATTWSPYLTMAEGLKLAAQTYTRDVSKLSCCAA